MNSDSTRVQELGEIRGGRPGLPVPNSPYGLCGRETTLNSKLDSVALHVYWKQDVSVSVCGGGRGGGAVTREEE